METRLGFESFQILDQVDSAKRYHLTLDPAFPLALNSFEYPAVSGAVPMTWHERLEIFCPLAGPGTFRIGEREEAFEALDILLIDNLRPHGPGRFEGPSRRALVVVFYPELVAAPGALPCDLWLLRPFRHLRDGCLHLRSGDRMAAEAWDCLDRLVLARVKSSADAEGQARQKAILVELLICLGEAFRDSLVEHSDYESRRDSLRRLAPLFEYVAAQRHAALSVTAAARMVKMSASYFMRFFRAATGLTFSVYVDQLRVVRAHQLLVDSDLSLAEIAAETGFCDQCHMSRHIRRRFGTTPGRIRSMARARNELDRIPARVELPALPATTLRQNTLGRFLT
jgi:AraC-like DNA-binding protein